VSVDPHDPWDLARFVTAQERDGTYDRALAELRSGRKRSHWMWFVFPQLAGLGRSATSQHFAITSLEQARAYLAHATLGPRLIECATVVAGTPSTPEQIFGGVDAMKLHSSVTLFVRAAPDEPALRAVLDHHFDGAMDPATEQLLAPRR
jgi:uncharacterized protein (DUF1810 family)